MKKQLLVIAFLVLTAGIISFRSAPENSRDMARVNKYQGVCIFIQSQPVADYTVLGTVKKTGVSWSGSPTEMFETLIRRGKKDYEDMEGIIFDDVKMEHATCIKFK